MISDVFYCKKTSLKPSDKLRWIEAGKEQHYICTQRLTPIMAVTFEDGVDRSAIEGNG